MQSFMNGIADGGHIILGLDEDESGRVDRDRKAPITYPLIPEGTNGALPNFDAYKAHLLTQFRTSTDRYLEGMVDVYEVPTTDGHLVVIEVPQSPDRPHFHRNGRAYIRADGHTYAMADAEICRQMEERSARRSESASIVATANAGAHGAPAAIPSSSGLRVSTFIGDQDVLARLIPFGNLDEASDIIWHDGPQAFLRLIPGPLGRTWRTSELHDLISSQGTMLHPFGRASGLWFERNSRGAVVFEAKNVDRQNTANRITQVFRNGEIWGINGFVLAAEENSRGYLACIAIEEQFENALANYLLFAERALGHTPPLRMIAGLSGVEGYSMALPARALERFGGNVVDDDIIYETEIPDYQTSSPALLLPFFELVWDATGIPRPDGFRA